MTEKQKRIKVLIIPIIFVWALFLASDAEAENYYVTQYGATTKTGKSCGTAKDLTWFNLYAKAGDTAYICAGTITTTLTPTNSGSSGGGYITYRADPGAPANTVIIDGGTYAANVLNKSYIKFYGIRFTSTAGGWIYLQYCNHIWIESCSFYNSRAGTGLGLGSSTGGAADDIVIKNCTFDDPPLNPNPESVAEYYWDAECASTFAANGDLPDDCNAQTAPLDFIGLHHGTRLLIEGNTFGRTSHNILNHVTSSKYNYIVFRNNTFRNTYRSVGLGPGPGPGSHHYLAEGNILDETCSESQKNPLAASRLHPGAWYDDYLADADGGPISSYGDYAIYRHNISKNGSKGFVLYGLTYNNWAAQYHRFYHNTSYNDYTGFIFHSDVTTAVMQNIKYKNNIVNSPRLRNAVGDYLQNTEFWISSNLFDPTNSKYRWRENASARLYPDYTLAYLKTNHGAAWKSTNLEGDPRFFDAPNGNFRLGKDSAATDRGEYLTTITAVNGNVITVDDSMYFYDGWSIEGEVGDTIYDDDGDSAVIQSIDYALHKLTVDDATGFEFSHGITTVNWSGAAPDIGAYEYAGSNLTYIPGDLNKDDKVDIADYSMFIQDFGKTGANLAADLNKNGQVEIGDYSIFISNFGKTS